MISEKLFEAAFVYKKSKLWRSLLDTEIFAVKLPDGEIGYCSIMGFLGEHCALGLYVGDGGFQSLRTLLNGMELPSNLHGPELLLCQDCMQCAFDAKDELTKDEIEAVRHYARTHGISLRGRNAFPHFVRYRPNCLPWFVKDKLEQTYLCEALAAAAEVARCLEKKTKTELGLLSILTDCARVPLLERKKDGFVWSSTPLPDPVPIQYPRPSYINDIAAAKLRRLKKEGFWECEVVRFPEPMQDSPEEPPYFPVVLLAVSGQVLPPQLSEHYEDHPEELVDQFAEMFLQSGVRPAMLTLRTERTKALLEDFCERAGIRIRMREALPMVDEAVESLMNYLGVNQPPEEGLEEMLDMLLQLDNLDNLPDEIKQQFAAMIEQESLPDELADELASRLGVGKPKGWSVRPRDEIPDLPFLIRTDSPDFPDK